MVELADQQLLRLGPLALLGHVAHQPGAAPRLADPSDLDGTGPVDEPHLALRQDDPVFLIERAADALDFLELRLNRRAILGVDPGEPGGDRRVALREADQLAAPRIPLGAASRQIPGAPA